MSSVAITGNAAGAGVFTIASPNSASSFTATLPEATTTLVGTDATQTLTNKTLGSGLVAGASLITSGTAVTASGASVDFTSIPSWVKRITVMFDGVSLSGSDSFLIQIGDSGGLEITGYNGGGARFGASSVGGVTFTTGFGFNNTTAACLFSGSVVLTNVTGNTWAASGTLGGSATEFSNILGGSKTLSAQLDRVSVTRTGTNTFDAGTINILYE